MISVIIPMYNAEKTIKQTIESILEQSYKDFEIIIVDDESIDNSNQIIKIFKERVQYFKIDHSGANTARNYGAEKANGEYLFFCDDDIILDKNIFTKLKKALDDNDNPSYAYCSFKIGVKKIPSKKFNVEELKKRNYISTMSLIRKKDFVGFDPDLIKFQDWDLWLTMLEQGKVGVFVPEVLFWTKGSPQGKSRWLPRIFYKIPWLKTVKKYNDAREIIIKKHGI